MKYSTSPAFKGIVLLLTSAFLYSLMPVMIRALDSGGIPPTSQVFLRYIFAFLSAVLYFLVFANTKVRVAKKDIFLLSLTTVCGYALTNLVFTYGTLYTTISNALFLFYTYAILAPVLGFLFLRERINRFHLIALVLSFGALVLLFQPSDVPTWKLGGVFALLAALGQAVYLILRKKLSNYPASFMMLANTFIGVVVVGALSLTMEHAFYFQGQISRVSNNVWWLTILFGIDNFLAWLTMTKGFEYFKSTAGSLILLSELIFGIILAAIFFREIPTHLAVIGGALIVCASALVILKGQK